MNSQLLGVVQGTWLIGEGGVRRPLTDKERRHFDQLDLQEQCVGKLVVYEDEVEQHVAYCHGIEHDDTGDYWQFADTDYSTCQLLVSEVTPRLATDSEVVADYLAKCRETAKNEYE